MAVMKRNLSKIKIKDKLTHQKKLFIYAKLQDGSWGGGSKLVYLFANNWFAVAAGAVVAADAPVAVSVSAPLVAVSAGASAAVSAGALAVVSVGASAAVMAAVSTVAAQQKWKQMQLTQDAEWREREGWSETEHALPPQDDQVPGGPKNIP